MGIHWAAAFSGCNARPQRSSATSPQICQWGDRRPVDRAFPATSGRVAKVTRGSALVDRWVAAFLRLELDDLPALDVRAKGNFCDVDRAFGDRFCHGRTNSQMAPRGLEWTRRTPAF